MRKRWSTAAIDTTKAAWDQGCSTFASRSLLKHNQIWRYQCSMNPEEWQRQTVRINWISIKVMTAHRCCNLPRGPIQISCLHSSAFVPNDPRQESASTCSPTNRGRRCNIAWSEKAPSFNWWIIWGRSHTSKSKNGRSRNSWTNCKICPVIICWLGPTSPFST